jgi:hypothetical protein
MHLLAAFPLTCLTWVIGLSQAFAATPGQAKALSERASTYIRAVGEETAFADFTRGDGAGAR